MKKHFLSFALALMALMAGMPLTAENVVEVSNYAGLYESLEKQNGACTVRLTDDIILDDKWFEDVCLASSDQVLRLKANETDAHAHVFVRERTATFIHVTGRKQLDLNGHTIQFDWYGENAKKFVAAYSAGDYPNVNPTRISLFNLMYCESFGIRDSHGGGQVILYSYEGHAKEVAAVYVPIGSHCHTLDISGGNIVGKAPWATGNPAYCGIVLEEEGVVFNLRGGKVSQIESITEAYVNILGGEVTANAGITIFKYAANSTTPGTYVKVWQADDHFFFGNGMIHGLAMGVLNSQTVDEWKACIPSGKKYFYSFDNKETTYDDFITKFRSAPVMQFRIMNGDYVPVVVNGTGLTDENAGDMLGDGGSVSWNEATRTLLLRNADVSSVVMNYTGSENLEYVIKVEGKSRVHGSGIKCTGAHLSIEGSEEDTLVVFGAGCKAIECDNQILLHNLYVDVSATSTNAIVATILIVDGAPLKAEAQTRAVSCDISYWQDIIYTYNYTSGSATSASFVLDVDLRKYKIWIAGKQMNIRNADDFKSEYTTGKISIADISRGKWTEGGKIILMLENASINAQSLYNGYSGMNPKGVPAIEIQEDSVTVIMDNVTIYSGDPTGVKYDGIDTRYYADGGHGIYFKPAHNNCELILSSQSTEKLGENGSVYINTYGKNQSSYPIRCEGPRLYIECNGTADSIVVHSEREVYCKTGLTLDDATIFSQSGFKTSNTPVITENNLGKSCYIAWPRAASFTSTGGVSGSTDNTNQGVLVLGNSRHLIPYTVEPNDESMGYCNPSSFETNYGRALNIKANPNSGYQFKEWHIYRKGKAGFVTNTEQNTTVEILSETRCVAMFEPAGGTPEEYPLWLKGTKVTSANCLDPAGDKKSEYKHADGLGQITFNGVNWALDGQAIYTSGISEVRVYCNGNNSVKGQSDWTMFFDDANIARFYFDTLRVGFNNPDDDSQGIFLSRYDTHDGVVELRNKLTHITGTSADHVAIVADTLKILDGSILMVDNAGMDIREGLVMPENYMIYPAGTYLAENGTMRDGSNNQVRTFRIAPKDPETPKYTITVNVNDPVMGSATGGGIFEEGEEVMLMATPNAGYEFVEWSNGSTENPFIAPACMDAAITAIFQEKAPEGFETIESGESVEYRKIIRDGVLYIEKNGKIYTVQGQEIR